MKIPFDIKYRPQIESGEYTVESENGRPVKILYWDANNFYDMPIIGLYNNGEVDVVIQYNKYGASGNNNTSLVIVTPDMVPDEDALKDAAWNFCEYSKNGEIMHNECEYNGFLAGADWAFNQMKK